MASKGDIQKNEIQPFLSKRWEVIGFEKSLNKTGSFTKLKSIQFLSEGKFPIVDQGEGRNSGYVNDPELLYKGEIPVVIFGDHTRNIKYIDYQFGVGADGTKILRPINEINPKFFYYYLRTLAIPSFGYSRHFKVLKEIDVPLPPLPEQERIVAKLDSIFAHLEIAKQGLEKIPVLLKEFRQAVLTQAVTGKLTEGKDWKLKTIESITTKVGSGSTPSGGQTAYQASGIPLVRSMNIHFGGIKNEGLAFLNDKQAYELRNVTIEKNDVLLNITGASIGRVCLAEDHIVGGRVNQHVSIVRANPLIVSPQFLNISMSSPSVQNYINDENYGVTRQALTKGQLLNLKILLPPIDKQIEIVRRVEALFSKADAIEARYKKLKEQIDQLPRAVLAKAFRGEV